jgi:hypothetical protein
MSSYVPPAMPYYNWVIHIGDGWYGITQTEKLSEPQDCFIRFGHPVATLQVSAPVFVSGVLITLFVFAAVVLWFGRTQTPFKTPERPTDP